jgi:hypothetical protein
MPISEVTTDRMMPSNLVTDAAYPLLTETITIDEELPIGSIIARDPATGIGSLVRANNAADVFGLLRGTVFQAGTLAPVYGSGSFITDTLKTDDSTSVNALEGRLRELGIYCRPSVHYPSDPSPPTHLDPGSRDSNRKERWLDPGP